MLFQTDQSACAVQFSPFTQGRIALATSQNFGIVGNGRVTILQASQAGFDVVVSYDTMDGAHQAAKHKSLVMMLMGNGLAFARMAVLRWTPPCQPAELWKPCLALIITASHHDCSHLGHCLE
jgi:hypothetical protein